MFVPDCVCPLLPFCYPSWSVYLDFSVVGQQASWKAASQQVSISRPGFAGPGLHLLTSEVTAENEKEADSQENEGTSLLAKGIESPLSLLRESGPFKETYSFPGSRVGTLHCLFEGGFASVVRTPSTEIAKHSPKRDSNATFKKQ